MKKGFPFVMKYCCTFILLLCLVVCPTLSYCDPAFSKDPDAIEEAANSVFMLEIYSSANQRIAIGSGFIAFDPSILVTNYHVIDGGAYIIAISDDKKQFLISQVCSIDKERDIVILKFDRSVDARPLPLDTDGNLKRSQTVVAIGSPAGLMNTVSIGNISAFYKKEGKDWIQFTAPISSGSSGGALFNDEGEIIGVTTATYASTQNINMAVKVKEVINLYNQWDKKTTTSMGHMKGKEYPVISSKVQTTDGNTVWVSGSGKKYHNNPSCSKMKNPQEIDLLDAIEQGLEPCSKCYK